MNNLTNKEHNYGAIYSPLVPCIDKFQGTIILCTNKYKNQQNVKNMCHVKKT